ncbi:class I SAM-dependent methyltransferase [Pseudarthrobacter sp. SL88]|uniref:SAM-dependent methyltransferase n=1 Tax=Pseudarthrobacter sp. SL88 TaxID=2994666 RepID=UPI0022746EEA|nr:class I SAM-dependent methyltransferase [Pseudarthrobacter sp. SL88]MCY1676583.1 class I SAM-dependent methyltransferase [Pseudarthrobacter sp. SL88]
MTDSTSLELPPLYESLTWLTPLSEERAARLVAFLSDPAPAEVLDMGCGWGELLLRVLMSAPHARGRGVDSASASIDRARQQALTRGLLDRATFVSMLGLEAQNRPADAVICIGVSQIWGPPVEDAQPLDYAAALRALRVLVLPGGRLVYGEAIWSATPHPAATAPLAGRDDEYLTEDALREQIRAVGFEVVDEDQASLQEWDVFEAGYRDRFTRWLEAHDADHPAAEQVRRHYEDQRAAYEEGYRGVLGMAYFCLRG